MKDRRFYVYEWYVTDTDEVFYFGKGTGDRYKRLNGRNYFFFWKRISKKHIYKSIFK